MARHTGRWLLRACAAVGALLAAVHGRLSGAAQRAPRAVVSRAIRDQRREGWRLHARVRRPAAARVLYTVPLGEYGRGMVVDQFNKGLFVDSVRDHVLVLLDQWPTYHDRDVLVEGDKVTRTHLRHGYMDILCVDFRRGYFYPSDIYQLRRVPMRGGVGRHILRDWSNLNVRPSDAVVAPSGGAFYVVIFPNGECATKPLTRVLKYVRGRCVSDLPGGQYPEATVYVPSIDRFYCVAENAVTLAGRGVVFRLPRRSEAGLYALRLGNWAYCYPIAASEHRAWIYYADPLSRILYKLDGRDGRILARRKITFRPQALALNERARKIYILDWQHRRLVALALF